ncbi:MAG TPA: ribosome small subunit-dependent GTPase A [Clostridiales bacterium]|nr:ribosome small subunit-dependent GTPase A [Clostridiales bacterium]
MIDGIIQKGIGGFYYVQTADEVYECKARGKFRKDKITPLVGDKVKISIDPASNLGLIEEILPRETELIRPPVANVNQAVIVFAIKQPEPNLFLLDKMLAVIEKEGLDIIICINKIDLDEEHEAAQIKSIYELAGYPVIYTSTKIPIGLEELKHRLEGKITVFAGPSGVGKSSLLNAIQPGLRLQTGKVSEKTKRGRHTTRHVELLKLDIGGWILDTPGFSALELECIEEEEVSYLFKEFSPFIEGCKFNSCKHIHEPDCAIKKCVMEGKIHPHRYESYIQFMEEVREKKGRY